LPSVLGLGEGTARNLDLRLRSRSRGVPIGEIARDCCDLEPLGLDFGKRPGMSSLARIFLGVSLLHGGLVLAESGSQRHGFILGTGEVFPQPCPIASIQGGSRMRECRTRFCAGGAQ
jgi:hypothetical protein